MKKIIFILTFCITNLICKAQLGYNYSQYDAGIGAALNYAYTDAETVKGRPAAVLNITYNHTPFLNYIAELQVGQLAGGDSLATLSGREFKNNYLAVVFRAQLQAGEIINYYDSRFFNALKNIYISGGIGAIYNNMSVINRSSLYIPDWTSPGQDQSSDIFIPLKAGYEFKLFNSYDEPWAKLDFGYQINYAFGDQLDGIKAGTRKDYFTQFVVGLKFAIGGKTSYRKQISHD